MSLSCHTFICLYRLREQQTQRQQQLRVYLCIWAGWEVFPPWLTQADGVSQLRDCDISLVMSGLCSALASFFTRHWNRGGAGVLSVALDCGVSLGRLVCVTACGSEEPWPAHRGEGWGWVFAFYSAGTKVFRDNNCTACKGDTETGICPLFNRLDDSSTYYWGCIQYKARGNTITPAFLFPTPSALFSTRQDSRITQTICIQDVQCFPWLPVSQPLPFCSILSVKQGTKGIWRPTAWLLPPVFTAGEWKHDCSVLELIGDHSCLWGCAGLLYPGETVARAVGLGCCAMWRLILCQAKQLGLVHWLKQTVTRLLGTVWLLYGRWYTGYNGLRKYSEWGKCHS